MNSGHRSRAQVLSAISWRMLGQRIFVCALFAAPMLSGQTRSAYQQAYRVWQQDDPSLEHDAASAGEALTSRTEKAEADAGKFLAARRAFYDEQSAQLAETLKVFAPFELRVETESVKSVEAYLSPQESSIANSIELFGGDADSGIQRLRQALEKERQALIALKSSLKSRDNAMETDKEAHDRFGRTIGQATERAKGISASLAQSAQIAGQLAQAWPVYYRALSNGARGLRTTETTPFDSADHPAAPQSPFAGLWAFEFGVSTYKGPSPFSCDLLVREEGGQLVGNLSAHFLGTGKTDSNVSFDFSGPLQASGPQSFPVQGAAGVKGSVELTPGAMPNLLEVNFKLEGASVKVREAGVVLVRR